MNFEKGITLRNFTSKDLGALEEFQKESIPVNFPGVEPNPAYFRGNLLEYFHKEPEGIKVLEKGSEIIGYIWMNVKYNSFRKKKYGLIRKLFIKKEYRGMGLAKKLMKVAGEYFQNKKVVYIQLKATLTNKAAVSLYKNAGFKEKRVIMEKEL